MFSLFKRRGDRRTVNGYIALLTGESAVTVEEVFRRCAAVEALTRLGPAARAAMPALLRTLAAPVYVDCGIVLRVTVAEALWKVGRRDDLALPFLAWALKDDFWGASRTAVRVLGEMGAVAHDAVPDLVRLADQRRTRGPFDFEKFEQRGDTPSGRQSLLALVTTTLGRCGRGVAYGQEARWMLTLLVESEDDEVHAAAERALADLGPSGI